jgi:predicted GTPase
VVDATVGLTDTDRSLIKLFEEKEIKYIVAYNKCDLKKADGFCISAETGEGINELKEKNKGKNLLEFYIN